MRAGVGGGVGGVGGGASVGRGGARAGFGVGPFRLSFGGGRGDPDWEGIGEVFLFIVVAGALVLLGGFLAAAGVLVLAVRPQLTSSWFVPTWKSSITTLLVLMNIWLVAVGFLLYRSLSNLSDSCSMGDLERCSAADIDVSDLRSLLYGNAAVAAVLLLFATVITWGRTTRSKSRFESGHLAHLVKLLVVCVVVVGAVLLGTGLRDVYGLAEAEAAETRRLLELEAAPFVKAAVDTIESTEATTKLGQQFSKTDCASPPSTEVGSRFACTSTGQDGKRYSFETLITGELTVVVELRAQVEEGETP